MTLPTILFFLLIITIAASYGIRRTMLDDNGIRNPLDLAVARQAAEAGLRDAERDLRLALEPGAKPPGATCSRDRERPLPDGLVPPLFGSACPRGQCRFDGLAPTPDHIAARKATPNTGCSFDGSVPLGTFSGAPRMVGVARQPEYLIEYMRRGTSDYFRITSRGFGADRSAEVVLQSYYRQPE